MNYLIVDIGNTNIVMAVFDGKKIKKVENFIIFK